MESPAHTSVVYELYCPVVGLINGGLMAGGVFARHGTIAICISRHTSAILYPDLHAVTLTLFIKEPLVYEVKLIKPVSGSITAGILFGCWAGPGKGLRDEYPLAKTFMAEDALLINSPNSYVKESCSLSVAKWAKVKG
jgi:hypothetical protein